jgi:glycosyltransferase involved in cell wall biosynthesis
MLANLRPEKGVEDFVRAASIVVKTRPDVRFKVWGDGPLRSSLENLARANDLNGKLDLPGLTATPELALRALDIFAIPSLSESSSNALMEAMATELPVVATRVGGTPSIVEDGSTGLLVPPGDPLALAGAILRLIEQPALAAGLAARGRKKIHEEFGIDQLMARIERLYEEFVPRTAVRCEPELR